MRETHKVRRGRCRHFDTFRDFYFADPKLIFCESSSFRKTAKKKSFRCTYTLPHDNDQSRRKFVSPPRSTLPYDNRQDNDTRTTPPPSADPMDSIGSCERRWQRHEVSKSNKGRAVFDGHHDSQSTRPIGEEHGQRQMQQEVGRIALWKKNKRRQEGW